MNEWIVKAWVRDAELEAVLNEHPNYEVREMFRNRPGLDGQETTTVVFRMKAISVIPLTDTITASSQADDHQRGNSSRG